MEATKSRGETHCFSLSCFHRSSEVPCKSNKNRSKNLAAIQINRKSDLKKKSKTMRQSDGHMEKKSTEVRSEWTNDVYLSSVFSR